MLTHARSLLLPALLLVCSVASAQVNIGVKVGANYVITSMDIRPDPTDAPTNPKGLGMLFGTYAEIRFSDMVGLRPELQFSFQRLKWELEATENNVQLQTQQGVFNGKVEQRFEDDQRL